ncbi:cystathionine beta-lyase [Streptococcus sp. BJSWXB6CM1]|uniref:Cystathionine beta-lyase n=1 Tax=Streptococcus fermentans TaxID=3095082 RepID=A0ABU5FUT5_9STRE|nr:MULTISPECIES: cystathionine beta-lyase [unclassified Streptococcus]MDY4345097.1 cystathionine beta-lyase [Streptococcus sp. BJSWXB5TM5]MDY4360519.1 cystathionine beta-lyase [Streptococcus sp. BJSWXB3CM3]MDY4370652.1 cystathionine beta-lyase [Streptococcus sp. BJSWXB6CM1]
MTDIKTLALKYGGYTSLDKVYLDQLLAGRSEEEQLALITPPPSVVNAYFAELYQKKSPQAATDYFAEVSQELSLYNAEPSFTEESKPFIRLNLSGKSFGFCYEKEGLGRIFSEAEELITDELLFEIAQIFPHQLVFEESGKIYLKSVGDEEVVSVENLTTLTDLETLADGRKRLKGYSQEDLLQEARAFSGKFYYRSENRTAMLYID